MFYFLSLLFILTSSQSDGNPHFWDRTRRCDFIDYDPPCTICEGIGGIAYGDENDQIHLTTCSPVATANEINPLTLRRPNWATQWYAPEYYGVMIGPKLDPFCYKVFPSNSSIGDLCYQPQQGPQAYNMEEYYAIRYDLELATVTGNVSSIVIGFDKYLWIVNKFPWYLGGFTQCICTEPKEGGTGSAPVYPLMYNWTNNLKFLGREKIDIEYIWLKQVELDHWGYGPHHIWSYPNNGSILRMWQPFNGLQVFPTFTDWSHVDASNFTDMPPTQCKKGGALMRIGCDDNGYPQPKTEPNAREIARAKNPIPGHDFRGENFEEMSSMLNKILSNSEANVKECDEFTMEELQQLQNFLHGIRHDDFNDIYAMNADPRQIFDFNADDYAEINELAQKMDLDHVVRDGHCHEAVMWFVHHLTQDVKDSIIEAGIPIPLLSYDRHYMPAEPTPNEAKIYGLYEQQVTCADCHSNYKPQDV